MTRHVFQLGAVSVLSKRLRSEESAWTKKGLEDRYSVILELSRKYWLILRVEQVLQLILVSKIAEEKGRPYLSYHEDIGSMPVAALRQCSEKILQPDVQKLFSMTPCAQILEKFTQTFNAWES